jgi:glutamate racemase
MKRVAFLHSTSLVLDPVRQVSQELSGEFEFFHVVDEGVLGLLMREGSIQDTVIEVVRRIAKNCEETGMNMMVCTCSSLSPVLDYIQSDVTIPLLKIDKVMFEYAVKNFSKIGVIMTNPTTQQPSRSMFDHVCSDLDLYPELIPVLCENAFVKIKQGDVEGHDQDVIAAVERTAPHVDIVILAQISIARVKKLLPEYIQKKTVSSLDFLGDTLRSI